MSRELNMDTQRQNFWKEAIDKETLVRLYWTQKYRNEIRERNTRSNEEKEAARIARVEKFTAMVPKLPSGTRVLPVISYPKRLKPKSELLVTSETPKRDSSTVFTEMRPVSPDVRNLLYHGFTKEGKGRYKYLHTRKLKKPEEKYGYPLTTSWEYGWKLNDVGLDFGAPAYGRSRIVRDTFFRRNGILYGSVSG